MTSDEIQASGDELARLGEQLRIASQKPDVDEVYRLIAAVGSVTATLAKRVAGVQSQLDVFLSSESAPDYERIQDSRAVEYFCGLAPVERERLADTVDAERPDISTSVFASRVATKSQLDTIGVQHLLRRLVRWYPYLGRNESEDSVNFVATLVLDHVEPVLRQVMREVDALNPASSFGQQFRRLLRAHATLGVSSKAEFLLTRNERQYRFATVSTDLRPIFAGDVATAPLYGVVIHNLIVTTGEGEATRKVGISMTSSDILDLADVLNRAWKKDTTLRMHSAYKLLPLK